MSNNTVEQGFPFTRYLTCISRQYDGAISSRLKHLDINRYYYPLLLIAEDEHRLTQQMLAERLGIDKVSMARMISYLSKKGYISRKKNPTDRREYMLEVTEKGAVSVPQIKKAFCEANRVAFQGLEVEEVGTFLKCVKTIQANLEEKQALNINHKLNTISSKPNYQYEKQLFDAK